MSEAFVGEIRIFGGSYAPVNWRICDGSFLSISNEQVLFALIGTTYGGDGVNTFALPDLRSRVPVGQGQGPGLTAHTIGQSFGTESVTLTAAQLPEHNHIFTATKANATTELPTNALFAAQSDGDQIYVEANGTNQPAMLAPTSVTSTGSNVAHNNIMPSLGVNYIICLNGIFPSRN
ncbi:phage tail protein [Shewanella morhuae]|uniref:Phage tail protein n=1 Tax=Shewanella morhuae TaxID=365591 RepID=A0ABX5HNR6_9GAMM|nr:tail fiber protein [Shewanella morhuae]PTA48518.1 phage tail protein [Shewanella morhuae]